ncbi:alpha/beta hydrolase [Nocardia sp. CDC159]|uniref:Alpha/beta hydrolase n=1 Tax=Nocardia pulmonis TaxID=2951408 RepID=A0A9X2E9M0_9NOCA|nr:MULTISPECIES: alpha/beta hydrolase [Nocardia]MCM6774361.1 alpha/beta hydrolase [Nocardia pulmonis]MCM6787573.1 alpha/beta hydrolase [Nocardia sp. CDC159]
MPDLPRPALVVALPGTGSDADFARRAFGPACAALDLPFLAVEPDPRAVVDSCRAALDTAARTGAVLAAGISLGAAIAVEWAVAHPEAVFGVIAALPAWTGTDTGRCPAALSAAATAAQLRADGLTPVIERMRASSPRWLGDALTQSWTAQWPHLPTALDEAAAYPWPTPETLAALTVPTSIVAAIDDPVHPLPIAEQWTDLIPHADLTRITLDDLGTDPAILGTRGLHPLLPRHAVHR